jgi:8-oxo-dGTP diphosphatase
MKGPLSLLPEQAFGILHEITRHLLKRPVVGIAVLARAPDGRILLVRRADTGTWALPGGTLEWGEELRSTAMREVLEECGATLAKLGKITGVYSSPKRDPRFHAVTIVVRAEFDGEVRGPKNALEIREAKLFAVGEIPRPLAMRMDDVVDDALREGEAVLE